MHVASPQRQDGGSNRPCPLCGAFLERIPRRLCDRITSIAMPVHRYHCVSFTCHWEGNLRVEEPAALPPSVPR